MSTWQSHRTVERIPRAERQPDLSLGGRGWRGIGRKLLGLAAKAWLRQGGKALFSGVLTANHGARAFYEAMGARFALPDVYVWDGHALDESIYIFENLGQLAHFA